MGTATDHQLPLEQLRQVRIEKLQTIRKLGIDPYPSLSHRTNMANDIVADFESLENKTVTVSGRLMSLREHGGLAFGHVQDESGQVQVYLKRDVLEETNAKSGVIGFADLGLFDVGDVIEATGTVTKTQSGEVSVLANQMRMLAKSIRPLPDKHDGLKDKEVIHRKRYLDLIINPENRYRFQKRAEITFAIRKFLNERGFLEIKTPILQPLYGGGLAKPFSTHVNALDVDFYLAIAHELYLKQLVTAGFEKVYNITGYFRNEGIDRIHNPEFELLETMTAFENYEYNMGLLEEMYKYIGKNVFGKMKFQVGGHEVDISKPWKRQMMVDAVKEHTGYDFSKMELQEAQKIVETYHSEDIPSTVGECMALTFEAKVEEKLIQPTIIFGHPVEISPLAKKMPNNPKYVERFELFLGGIETGDNWSELNDPLELFERFKEQAQKRKGGFLEAHQMDIDFIEAMEYGMPPTTGLGPGIDRLVMLFTEAEYIDDVIFFPIMKPRKITDFDTKVYGVKETESKEETVSDDLHGLPSIPEAEDLLHEHVKDDYQVLHAHMIGTALKEYAKKAGENQQLWYITGLLHDLDYFEFPDEHPNEAIKWFKQLGYPQALIHAVAAHYVQATGVKASTKLAKVLCATDELSGLIYAYSLMRPNGFDGMEAKSIIKKMGDKGFARKVDRNDVEAGLEMLDEGREKFIQFLIDCYKVFFLKKS